MENKNHLSSFIIKNGLLPWTVCVIFICTLAMTSAAQTSGKNPNKENILGENYRIGVGDVIDVSVSQNEQLSKTGIRVNNQGFIQLPMIDTDVSAACLTERELADHIKGKYKKYLLEPYVNITIREFNSNPVAFIGAVNAPGRFQMQRPVRLLELLTFVNGPRDNAGDQIEIIRNQRLPYCNQRDLIIPPDADDELIAIALSKTLSGDTQANPFVKAGDIIRIEEAEIKQAYIIGNVKNAVVLQLKEPITLTQAVAMAGGVTPDADIEKIKLKRRSAGSLSHITTIVNLKDINKQKKEDILIEADDIIEVPGPTGGKKILKDIFKTLIPTVTRLPISVIP